ncbi:MAG: hypothetical protein DRI73_11400 [Bacteroidetes bacterium]|nr:MAG: hypothetical protein DRI73_11400 [Bacteroidota bacterium]
MIINCKEKIMNTYKVQARFFGIFFILSFLFYGLGSGLIESVIGVPDILSNVYANKTRIIIGAILMAILHTFTNIAMPVLILPILKKYNKYLSYGYLSAAIAATVTLVVGAIFLLLLLPLSDEYLKASSVLVPNLDIMAIILKKGGYFSYQLGMALWSLGGFMFCMILYQSKLVPRLLSIWGFAGYVIFISGTILELFGYNIGVLLSLPAGLFEISLSLWLIFKSFNTHKLNSN